MFFTHSHIVSLLVLLFHTPPKFLNGSVQIPRPAPTIMGGGSPALRRGYYADAVGRNSCRNSGAGRLATAAARRSSRPSSGRPVMDARGESVSSRHSSDCCCVDGTSLCRSFRRTHARAHGHTHTQREILTSRQSVQSQPLAVLLLLPLLLLLLRS